MISLEDCIALCGLDESEVAAISEHEHIPEIAASALADYLLKQAHGSETIRAMVIEDIHKALDEEAPRQPNSPGGRSNTRGNVNYTPSHA